MQSSSVKKFNFFLNFTFIMIVIAVVSSLITAIKNPEFIQMNNSLNMIMTLLSGIVAISIFIMLKSFIKSVEQNKPFCKNNILRLKKVAYLIFVLGVADLIIKYPQDTKELELFATSYGSIKISVFPYILLGLFH